MFSLPLSPLLTRGRAYLADYLLVLGGARGKLRTIVAQMLGLATLDLLGVGLVAPFAQVLTTGSMVLPLSGLGGRPRVTFLLLGLTLVAVFLVKALVGYRLSYQIVAFSGRHRADLIRRLMGAYQAQTWQFHLDRNTSELTNRVLWYTETYAYSTLAASLQLVTDTIVCAALLVLLASTDLRSVAILGGFLGIVFLATHQGVRPRLRDVSIQAADSSGRLIRGTRQALQGFREARILETEDYFRHEVSSAAQVLAAANARRTALGQVPRYTFEVAVVAVLVVIGSVTALVEGSPSSAVPTLGMFAAAAIRLVPASTSLLSSLNQIRSSRFVLGDLAGELREEVARAPVQPAAQDTPASTKFESLELENVSFTYPGSDATVLTNVNLVIRAGDTVGLMGRSGAGKSTLADVMLGFLEPAAGYVRVNGKDIHANLRAWLRCTSYIPQNVFLIDDTVRRNIAFGIPENQEDEKRMKRAVERAQLSELVAALPDGLDTVVGEDGVRLSGGQRQRVALARALYHERQFIVLDEATSALDEETEDAVVRAIMGLAGEKTVVVIAHRESTVSACDIRLMIKDGVTEPSPRTTTA